MSKKQTLVLWALAAVLGACVFQSVKARRREVERQAYAEHRAALDKLSHLSDDFLAK